MLRLLVHTFISGTAHQQALDSMTRTRAVENLLERTLNSFSFQGKIKYAPSCLGAESLKSTLAVPVQLRSPKNIFFLLCYHEEKQHKWCILSKTELFFGIVLFNQKKVKLILMNDVNLFYRACVSLSLRFYCFRYRQVLRTNEGWEE